MFSDARLTRRQVRAESIRLAKGLLALGVGPGDHVGILMRGGAQMVLFILAVARVGAVAVPINDRFKSFELGFVASDSDMRVLLVADEFADLLDDALPSLAAARAGAPAPARGADAAQRGRPRTGRPAPGTTAWAAALAAGEPPSRTRRSTPRRLRSSRTTRS